MAGPEFRRRVGIWFSRLLDCVYPPLCGVCGEVQTEGKTLCGPCDGKLPRLEVPFCSRCGEHFEGAIDGNFICPNCSSLKFAFEFARPAMTLDPRTRSLIHQFKYGKGIHLAAELGRLAAEGLADPRFEPALREKWPLVPVPLHRARQRWRHFNQAEEIARVVGGIAGLPVLAALKRTRITETQTHLTRNQRLENLRGAFQPSRAGRRREDKAGAILVDDVLTTGSTVDACARALRAAGFKSVFVLTVMRG